MIDYLCYKCGCQMSSPDSLIGQVERCPECGANQRVPLAGSNEGVAYGLDEDREPQGSHLVDGNRELAKLKPSYRAEGDRPGAEGRQPPVQGATAPNPEGPRGVAETGRDGRKRKPASEAQIKYALDLGLVLPAAPTNGLVQQMIATALFERGAEKLASAGPPERRAEHELPMEIRNSDTKHACTHCKYELSSPMDKIGKYVVCPKCQKKVRVPDPELVRRRSLASYEHLVYAASLGLNVNEQMTKNEVSSLIAKFDKTKHYLYGLWIKLSGRRAVDSGIEASDMQAFVAAMVNSRNTIVDRIHEEIHIDESSSTFLRRNPVLRSDVKELLLERFGDRHNDG